MSNCESEFTSLVEQTGAAEAEHLRLLARIASSKVKLNDEKLLHNKDDELTGDAGENDPLILKNYCI